MLIKNISWKAFRLPFAGAFKTAQGVLAAREGFIVQVEADNGLIGLGEAAPLPEFGGGRPHDVLALLQTYAPIFTGLSIAGLDEQLGPILEQGGPGVAAFCCALDTAACDLLSQQANQPLADWLSSIQNPQSKIQNRVIPVNATVGAPTIVGATEAALGAIEQGFECIKLKVGMRGNDIEAEVTRVKAVRAALGPKPKLRLDANGGWTVDQAIAILQEVAEVDIELVEQPVAPTNLAGMAAVRRAVPQILIAADEPVTSYVAAQAIIEAWAADVLVIKPMVVGGLRPGRRIIELAQAAGLQCFVTTTIDSGVGIAAALHLAATLSPPRLHCGLATASLLTHTLVEELPPIVAGQMLLPNSPGLGVRLLA